MVQAAKAGTNVTAALTVKSVEQLAGSGTRFAYAVKAGPWIFLNGHEAFDFQRGLAPEVEGPLGSRLTGRPPLRREADYILQRMRSTLKEFGCDLANAVRVDQYYTSGQAVHAYHLARFAEFGSYIPPSTSIIMPRCFTARTNIHTSMIAVVPGRTGRSKKPPFPARRFPRPATVRPSSSMTSSSSPAIKPSWGAASSVRASRLRPRATGAARTRSAARRIT